MFSVHGSRFTVCYQFSVFSDQLLIVNCKRTVNCKLKIVNEATERSV